MLCPYLRKEEISPDCTLYLADARDMVPHLERAKLFCSDVPYRLTSGGVGFQTEKHKPMRGGWCANYKNDGLVVTCDITWREIMELAKAVTMKDADIYVMSDSGNVTEAGWEAKQAGLREHNLLVWNKKVATPNRWYMKVLEFTLYLYKGRARPINDCSAKQLISGHHKDVTDHPTEKPDHLMEHYIRNSTDPGDLVIDTFMGSGTTGVAAIQSGRRFIGIEIEPKHFETAVARCREALARPQSDFGFSLEEAVVLPLEGEG